MANTLLSNIVGVWSLVSYAYFPTASPAQKSYPIGSDATGTIMYHPSGYMSAVLTRSGVPPFSDGGGLTPENSGTEADWATVGRNVIAYSGRFWVKDESTVVHELGVCMLSRLQGTVQERKVEFRASGKEMLISVDGVNVGGVECRIEVEWTKAGDNDVHSAIPGTSTLTTK